MEIDVHPVLDQLRFRHSLEPQPRRPGRSLDQDRRVILGIVDTECAEPFEFVGVIVATAYPSRDAAQNLATEAGWAQSITTSARRAIGRVSPRPSRQSTGEGERHGPSSAVRSGSRHEPLAAS